MGKVWRGAAGIGVAAALAMVGMSACGDDDDTPAAAGPQVDPDPLRIEIQSATVPEFATTARPTVRFRVVDGSGAAVNLEAEMATTAGFPRVTTSPRFTLAMLDDNGDYRSYYEANRAAARYNYDGAEISPTRSMTQATAQASSSANLRPVAGSPGLYEFTFPPVTVGTTSGFDRTKTHTIGAWMRRTVAQGGDIDAAGATFNFVPAGAGAVQRDEVISDAACNRCHGFVEAHDSRRGTQLCLTCHSPQTNDPETERTVDFKVMIHKIHRGSLLPSVRAGEPYYIVGNRQTVHDWTEAAFPWHDHGVQHCTVCHTGGEDSGNWRTRPTLAACTSCHDNVQFTSAAGLDPCPTGTTAAANFRDCMHRGGPVTVTNANDVTSCAGCHAPGTAAPIDRYHHGD